MLSPRERTGFVLFVVTLLGSTLAVGTIHAVTLCVVTAMMILATCLLWHGARPSRSRAPATALVVLGVCLILYTALQAIPLPATLVRVLAPANADVWARAVAPFGLSPPLHHPLSLDPGATRTEVLRGVAYLAAFLCSLRVSERREGVRPLILALLFCVLTVTVVSLLHPAFGAAKVFGIYRPDNIIAERHVAPLLNPNSLAAYVNVGICIALAGILSPRPLAPRPILVAVLVVLVGTEVWIASRGGLVGMALGIAIVFGTVRASTKPHQRVQLASFAVGSTVVAGAVLLTLAASKDAWDEVSDTDTSKLETQWQMLGFVWDHRWFGVGRGAFESTFPAYRHGSGYVVFTHPEQILIQWSSEWGLPVAAAALCLILWSLRPQVVVARTPVVIGPWAAIAACAVHNLVDLNSEIPAIMLMLASCAGLVVGGTSGEESRISHLANWAQHSRIVVTATVLIAVTAIAWVLPTLGRDLYSDRFAARATLRATQMTNTEYAALAAPWALRHPGEPYFSYIGMVHASISGKPDIVRFAESTLERAPVYPPAHLLLGRWLRNINPSQARFEYRTALQQAPDTQTRVLQEAESTVRSFDDAMELVPESRERVHAMETLAGSIGTTLPSTLAMLDDAILEQDHFNHGALTRKAERASATLLGKEPWCEAPNRDCRVAALSSASVLIDRWPSRCSGYALRAWAVAEDDASLAASELDAALDKVEDRTYCLRTLLRLAQTKGLATRVTAAVDKLVRTPCATEDACVANLTTAGAAELSRGQPVRALAFYRRAHERYPTNELALEQVGAAASAAGLHAEARDAYARLAKLHPDDARWSDAERREHVALGPSSRQGN